MKPFQVHCIVLSVLLFISVSLLRRWLEHPSVGGELPTYLGTIGPTYTKNIGLDSSLCWYTYCSRFKLYSLCCYTPIRSSLFCPRLPIPFIGYVVISNLDPFLFRIIMLCSLPRNCWRVLMCVDLPSHSHGKCLQMPVQASAKGQWVNRVFAYSPGNLSKGLR